MGDKVAEKVLFSITEENLETGMRGYPVGYCPTSSADPQKGLHYVGRPVASLAQWEPERVIDLLYHGKERNEGEWKAFAEELRGRAHLKRETWEAIAALPRQGHPMKLFSAALLILGMLEGKGDYREDCLNVIAKIPLVTAAVINHHAGWEQPNPSNPLLGYIENFCQLLGLPSGKWEELTPVFKLFNILHYDHGGGNLSAFTGKGVASGLEDIFGSLSAAMCALAGPRHGKANQDALAFLERMCDELGEGATPDAVEGWVRGQLESHALIYGFGHAVLRVEDPRATLFYDYASQRYLSRPLVQMALMLRNHGSKVLKENPKIADPYPNVDAISGTLLTSAGFPHPEYFTVLFGMARVVGIAIQIVYERCEAREGKGTPIIRPKFYYRERPDTHEHRGDTTSI